MPSKKQATDAVNPTGDNVEQIREILFGGHIRAFDERFDLVEARLAKESAALQKTLEKRIADLERMLGEYREESGDQLGSEASNRELALNKIELALASTRMDAENQMAQMQDDIKADIKALKDELDQASKESTKALERLKQAQDKRAEKLDADKVDREQLSEFLIDIANRIQPAKDKRSK